MTRQKGVLKLSSGTEIRETALKARRVSHDDVQTELKAARDTLLRALVQDVRVVNWKLWYDMVEIVAEMKND
jgi:hypothetical protein